MTKGIVLIITSVIFTLIIWISGLSGDIQFSFNLLARMYGLIGIVLLCWNYILSTRLKIFEELFDGLDNLYSVHHWIGKWGFLLILSHPILLLSNAVEKGISLDRYLLPSANAPYSFGVLGLYILIILLFVTLVIKLPYHLWKLTHDFMGIPLFILFLHVLLISSDTSRNLILRYWVLGIILIAIFSFIYKRFIYEHLNRLSYTITKIDQVSTNIYLITLQKISGEVKYFPGNFVFFKRVNGDNSDEMHPFSVVSSDESGNITLAIKNTGDYTSTVPNWNVGEEVSIYGPYGRFGKHFNNERKELWIAGGIGITPYLSVLDEYRKKNLSAGAHLIFTVSEENDVPFLEQLNKYAEDIPGFSFEIWNTKVKGWFSPKEYIASDIEKYLICASEKSTKQTIKILKSSGVKRSKISKELFKLY